MLHINGLLPLSLDSAHSVAMIKHSRTLVQSIVGQVLVRAGDQLLFALTKQIKWSWPSTLEDDHL